MSYRQVRRIYRRFRAHGQKGLVHGNAGRRCNHAHDPAVRARAVALITEHFSGPSRGRGQRFGPALATEQDRLVKKLRRLGVKTYAAANVPPRDVLPAHNSRFAAAPAAAADFHLPIEPRLKLAQVFCLEEGRVVGNDWVVRYHNRALQSAPTLRAKRSPVPRHGSSSAKPTRRDIFIVARSKADGDQCLDWTPVVPAAHMQRKAARHPSQVVPA